MPDGEAGKSCGDCGLCCKLMGVTALAKPQGKWCPHFSRRAGCKIYEDRPHDCREFICYWLHAPNLGDEWRPDRAGFANMRRCLRHDYGRRPSFPARLPLSRPAPRHPPVAVMPRSACPWLNC